MTKKMREKIHQPKAFGALSAREGMRVARGAAGSLQEGESLQLYLLVDESDGKVVDARFQLFGPAALIAAAEASCDLLVGKNLSQVRRIGADLIDKQLRDSSDEPAFPEESWPTLNLIIDAIDDAMLGLQDFPEATSYTTPLPESEGQIYPGWEQLTDLQKKAVLEELIEIEIRPYIELDEGGIEIKELKGNELVISYQGACTSCYSSVGATLSTISQIIRNKVHPDLLVSVDPSALTFQQ